MELDTEGEGFYLEGRDGKDIYIHQWEEILKPRAVVQIFHGMAEHGGRYQRFAEFLNKNGFIVYADDHRGHGKTAGTVDKIGYIGEDGYNRIVEDEHLLTELIKARHPELPVFVFAHSFGSFIGQSYITKYGGDIAGVILSGSAAKSHIEIFVGKILAYIECSFVGKTKRSHLVDAVCFATYNKKIANPKSEFAWISRDDYEVNKYEADDFCGTPFTMNYFYYLFKGLGELNKKGNFKNIPQKLPIYIMSGADDPVGSYTKSVKKLYEMYEDVNIKDIELMLYPGGRHEMLNEINREEVFNNILEWLNKHILNK